ncbi:MAG: hypothetical protein P9M06_01805 [Candidatus Saelkia tenebricola]|nr:hypothetical protein [Candidatus Saelkia tenebricola]
MSFNLVMGLFLGIPVGGMIVFWFFFSQRYNKYIKEDSKVWECEFCLNVYTMNGNEDISKCPFCDNYNKTIVVNG